ncbi:recombinase family protein [Salipaludibacillus agaradhaerens]|jgi:DNA invertase Pin-like site-specific DNA recombinase|uniref:recombinase family protein n=1 Tax=Salipaludibacillus agaradhaerens TaxID=76935 RepID=UPI002150E80F|nr:recombinase family protein [Salipaludibacillus agaradhaerens]MCR6108693.1 recombinase family protein [Salipaludibacillus agaradhaerens]MCR6120716.1 recombinase family protein [Salipaludibacillus agaradhaerens]
MKIGYARVSTKDQSLDLQIDALEKYGAERIYSEKESGGKWDRAELTKCLEHLRPGDTLIVYKLDRLARSQKQLIEIADRLREEDVELLSISEQLDTHTAMGRAMFGMIGVMAELERNMIMERTAAGLAAARARGRRGGRPKMNPEKVQHALALYDAQELTVAQITQETGVSKALLYKELNKRKENGAD